MIKLNCHTVYWYKIDPGYVATASQGQHTDTTIHTHICGHIESPINSLGCVRKTEYPEETHTDKGRTFKHRKAPAEPGSAQFYSCSFLEPFKTLLSCSCFKMRQREAFSKDSIFDRLIELILELYASYSWYILAGVISAGKTDCWLEMRTLPLSSFVWNQGPFVWKND